MANRDISKERTKAASQKVKERDYWLNKLSGQWEKVFFYYDNPEPKEPASMQQFDFTIDGNAYHDMMRLRNGSDQRLFMLLITQLSTLLYKYTGHHDLIVGAPIYRQETSGNFINTLLMLRHSFQPETTFKQLLLSVRQTLTEAEEHQNYPMEALLHKLEIEVPAEGEDFPIFDVTILLENLHDPEYIAHIKTNISFRFLRTDKAIEGKIIYNARRYAAESIQRIAGHFKAVVAQAAASLDKPLNELEILSTEEKSQILDQFNDTGGEYPEGKTIHQWFEEQAAETPDQIALMAPGAKPNDTDDSDMSPFRANTLTYDRLNKKANQLARLLQQKGVGLDTIVALIAERSLEMIVGLLAILKAGGAYLPIDTNYPEERKKYMLTDSRVNILLSNHDKTGLAYVPEEIEIIDIGSGDIYIGNEENLEHQTTDSNLVYLIYTSGSTGQPKGVMLEHRNVVNLIHWDFHYTNLDFSKILQFHTIGFDASFHEIFCALLSGGQLILVDEDTRVDVHGLFKIIETHHIPTIFLPMSFLRIIFNDPQYADRFPTCVKHIQTAGEQVVVNSRFRRFLQHQGVYLHNHYGPSETHVVTALTLDPKEPIPELPHIGKPILNTTTYILDKERQLLPIGVPGELYLGGIQVGRGYLHKPDLTEEKFWQHAAAPDSRAGAEGIPLSQHHPPKWLNTSSAGMSRLYRTGDLARWLPDGSIEFLGRIDTQVKIRGFRIEPGEIESKLMDMKEIKEAVVIDRADDNGEKYLCAYVIAAKENDEIDIAGLRERLGMILPDYMVPSYMMQIERIPLSPNGKVKRDALPDIEEAITANVYVAPRDDLEKELCRLWSQVLGVEEERLGIDDNFFELGGHSLKATILISKIHKAMDVKLILGQLFSQPTVRGLAGVIKTSKQQTFRAIRPAGQRPFFPMSSAQKRMYIAHQLETNSLNYNMPAAMIIEGALDKTKLETAFRRLMERQEGLRTRFLVMAGEPVQQIVPIADIDTAIPFAKWEGNAEATEQEITGLIHEFVQPFDLEQAPLFRARLVELAPQKYLLMVDLHHIIGDGVSMGVMIREFTRLYEGQEPEPLAIQYRDYAVWHQQLEQSGELTRQEEYWLNLLSGDIPQLNLPLDYPRPQKMSFEGRWLDFKVEAPVTTKLKKLADRHDATLYMVLLAAYNVLLNKYSGQETVIVGSAIAGRSHPDLEEIIGVFLNTLVMKNTLSHSFTFSQLLEQVRQNALKAYENQDCQFEELVEKLNLKRDYSRNPIFDTMLNYVNMDIPEIKLSHVTLTPHKMEVEAVKFDIKINARELKDEIVCTLDYATKLFKPETIDRFIENYLRILSEVADNPDVKLADISLLSSESEKQLVDDFNEELDYEF